MEKKLGWGLSLLVVAFLIFGSASGKFTEWPGKQEMFAKFGYDIELMKIIGVVEVLVSIIYLIPRVSLFGAILLTAYLGGATATHVRVGDAFYFPIIIGCLVWVGLGLRNPKVKELVVSP